MYFSINKIVIAIVLVTGLVGALALQAHTFNMGSMNMGSNAEGSTNMPMGMQNGMMGMSGQMSEMMSACIKMMEAGNQQLPEGSVEAK